MGQRARALSKRKSGNFFLSPRPSSRVSVSLKGKSSTLLPFFKATFVQLLSVKRGERKGRKIGNSICYSTSPPSLSSLRNGTKQAAVVFLFFFKTTEWWRRQRFSRNGSSREKKRIFFKKRRRLVVCSAILDAAMKKEKEEEAMLSLTQVLFRPPPPFLPNRKQTFSFLFLRQTFCGKKDCLAPPPLDSRVCLPLFLSSSSTVQCQQGKLGKPVVGGGSMIQTHVRTVFRQILW